MKSEQIIKDFWREAEELKIPFKSIGFLERDGVCACNAEMTIEKAKNPREFRSFLLVAFVIDQTMYTFFQNIYVDFRQSFFLPKY